MRKWDLEDTWKHMQCQAAAGSACTAAGLIVCCLTCNSSTVAVNRQHAALFHAHLCLSERKQQASWQQEAQQTSIALQVRLDDDVSVQDKSSHHRISEYAHAPRMFYAAAVAQ